MAERQGRPVRVGDVVQRIASGADRTGGLAAVRVMEVWAEVVGGEIDRHTAGFAFRAGELVVSVDSHSWASELTALSETLKERVNSVLGEMRVERIRFTVSRRVCDERDEVVAADGVGRGYGGEHVEPAPLSEVEREEVVRSTAGIASQELREAAIRATVRDLEWKKAQEAGKNGQGPSREGTDPKTGLLP